MFLESFCLSVIKSPDCVVKGSQAGQRNRIDGVNGV